MFGYPHEYFLFREGSRLRSCVLEPLLGSTRIEFSSDQSVQAHSMESQNDTTQAMEVEPVDSSAAAPPEYRVMSQTTHILERPDMYLGPVEPEPLTFDIVKLGEDGKVKFESINVELAQGFLKIVDEVVCNAQDHQKRDPGLTTVAVTVDAATGLICVTNNGSRTVPTSKFEGTDKTVAEVVFGTPLSGSNFTKDDKKTGIGKNGIGVKITNIYSTRFELALIDPENGVEYHQRWKNNMQVCEPPRVKNSKLKKASTSVTFLPDYARFKIELPLDPKIVSVLENRVRDIAVTMPKKVSVSFNGNKIEETTIKSLGQALGGTIVGTDKAAGGDGAGMELVLVLDASHTRAISYVNGIRCKGKILDHIYDELSKALGKKFPSATRILSLVKENISVVAVSTVVNPDFESQCKNVLTTPISKLGFAWTPSATHVKTIAASSFKQAVEASITKKTDKESSKAIRSKKAVSTKYQKPTKVGGKKQCNLFICEGDSAKQMVVSGFRKIGRDYNGVYPLKGKVLNTHDVTIDTALKNQELLDLIHILCIDPRVEYTPELVRKLPFSSVFILCDQDHDGFHITGLVTTFFKKFFPSLLKHNPKFLRRFVTPIVKARDPRSRQFHSFFSIQAFKEWNDVHRATECRYYKGLGTSSDKEAQEYFSDMSKHSADFQFVQEECHSLLSKWFANAESDERKKMIREIDHDSCVDYSQPIISITDFCNKELVHWSYANVLRTIPALDGLKPGQRKVLYTLFHDKKVKTYKVAEMAANVIGFANFHHGEASLQESIAHMVQSYIGTNQIAYLEDVSQAGSRDDPPKVHAAPRYEFTRLGDVARYMMVSDEDGILDRMEDDGKIVEPKCYATTVPMALINSMNGVGTGFSTDIPEYSLTDVITRCMALAEHGSIIDFDPLTPKPHDFVGNIVQVSTTEFRYEGIAQKKDAKTICISELPPQMWTNVCKEKIEEFDHVKEVVVHSTGERHGVNMCVHVDDNEHTDKVLERVAKHITKTAKTTNMHLFNAEGVLVKYETPEEVLRDHAIFKVAMGRRRLDAHIERIQSSIALARAKAKYIQLILTGEISIMNIKKAMLVFNIEEHGLKEFQTNLLQMGLTSLTEEESEQLKKNVESLQEELRFWMQKTPEGIWLEDLKALGAFVNKKRSREDGDM
jgi:DNA topoisomerase-2